MRDTIVFSLIRACEMRGLAIGEMALSINDEMYRIPCFISDNGVSHIYIDAGEDDYIINMSDDLNEDEMNERFSLIYRVLTEMEHLPVITGVKTNELTKLAEVKATPKSKLN